MWKCNSCGEENPDSSNSCQSCGMRFSVTTKNSSAMNLSFKAPLHKPWTISNDRIIVGDKIINLYEISRVEHKPHSNSLANFISVGVTGHGFDYLWYSSKDKYAAENVVEYLIQKAEIRDRDEKEYEELTKYCRYIGRGKRIHILKSEIESLKSVLQLPSMLMNSVHQEKEHDWAIIGGFGGVGAAIDAQIKNIEIRARNQANKEAMANFAYGEDMFKLRLSASGKIADLEEKIKKEENALISELSEKNYKEIMNNLSFFDIKTSITESGAVKISVKVKLKSKLNLLGNVDTVVDGVVIAKVYQNNTFIGETKIVLPHEGISTKAVTVNGICLCHADKNKECDVRFEIESSTSPDRGILWAIEK